MPNYFDDTGGIFSGINFVPCNFISGWRQWIKASRMAGRRLFVENYQIRNRTQSCIS